MRKTHPLEIVVVVICLFFLAWLVVPPWWVRHNPRYTHRSRCRNNLMQLGLAMKQYTQDYGDRYPWRTGAANPDDAWLDLGMLFPNYTSAWKNYLCPSSKDRPFAPMCLSGDKADYPLEPLHSANNYEVISYAYCIDARDPQNATAWTENAHSTVLLLADKKAGVPLVKRSNHKLDGRNVLYHDCHVAWNPGARALDPDEDDDEVGPPKARECRAWWSDPPYYGE